MLIMQQWRKHDEYIQSIKFALRNQINNQMETNFMQNADYA